MIHYLRRTLSIFSCVMAIFCMAGLSAVAQNRSTPPVMPLLSINVPGSTGDTASLSAAAEGRSSQELPPLWPALKEHPLAPVIRWAEQGLPALESMQDYSATLVRRERIHGSLTPYEHVFVKIRHEPFSVYVYFLAPESAKGQEVVYVAGRNQGNMWAHKARLSATVSISPRGMIAMNGRHYPLTEIGVVNLVRRLVEVGTEDEKYGECEVKYFTTAKVDGRPCTVIQVVHPVPRDAFTFHLARIYVDDALKMPIRYESYDWPSEPGGNPRLIEEYTYLNVKLNNGFTDEDFSVNNPAYGFTLEEK